MKALLCLVRPSLSARHGMQYIRSAIIFVSFCLASFAVSGASVRTPSNTKLLNVCRRLHQSADDALISAVKVQRHTRDQRYIADVLGWLAQKDASVCHGQFVKTIKAAAPSNQNTIPIHIEAHKTSMLSRSGTSVLRGHVLVREPGQQLTADNACLFRHPKTHEISAVTAIGRVQLDTPEGRLVAGQGKLQLADQQLWLHDVLYRLDPKQLAQRMGDDKPQATEAAPVTSKKELHALEGISTVWGSAKSAHRDADRVLHLRDATFTTCSPDAPVWQLSASHISLDRERGWGQASNSVLWWRNVPIFYFPWFSFPLDKRRKSGLLYPLVEISDKHGLHTTFPFYWNLAPNYDLTTSLQVYEKRGVGLDGLWRYLTQHSHGQFVWQFVPNDTAFATFREQALQDYAEVSEAQASLDRLRADTRWRGFASWEHDWQINPQWRSHLELARVTDDYYLSDFERTDWVVSHVHLPSELLLDYDSPHWQLHQRLLVSQTLHPVNQSSVSDLYYELPRITAHGEQHDVWAGADVAIDAEAVHFVHHSNFLTGQPVVAGNRWYAAPILGWEMHKVFGFLKPQLTWTASRYVLNDEAATVPREINRVVPIASVDGGLFFDRKLDWGHHVYRQTLEPRLYYLYIPKRDQSQIPLFDTSLPALTYQRLFLTNRFSGVDRIGDANQLSLGVSSGVYDADTGMQRWQLSLGERYAFTKHSVCIDAACSRDVNVLDHLSPLAMSLRYYGDDKWHVQSDYTWDPNKRQNNEAGVNIVYQPKPRERFNLDYYLGRNQDVGLGIQSSAVDKDLHRLGLGVLWEFSPQWHAAASWHYNVSQRYATDYNEGLEYESCCWTARFMVKQAYDGLNATDHKEYNRRFYLQIEFKGLGGLGRSEAARFFS